MKFITALAALLLSATPALAQTPNLNGIWYFEVVDVSSSDLIQCELEIGRFSAQITQSGPNVTLTDLTGAGVVINGSLSGTTLTLDDFTIPDDGGFSTNTNIVLDVTPAGLVGVSNWAWCNAAPCGAGMPDCFGTAAWAAVRQYEEFCNGDGGVSPGCTDCPCMNNAPAGTSGGCLNSAGSSANLVVTGDSAVSLPMGATFDLRFSLAGAPPTAFCILNSGSAAAPQSLANPCFGLNSGSLAVSFDGLRCAVQNTQRHGGRPADVNGDVGISTNPWGGEAGPFPGIGAVAGFLPGQVRYFQVIHRDDPLQVCMRALNTSQTVRVIFTP